MHNSDVPQEDAVRFPAGGGGAGASAPQPTWQGGAIEVEFDEDVRPELGAHAGSSPELRSPAAVDLGGLNEILQRHGLQRAEPSIPMTEAAADEARAAATQGGASVPHYANLVTLHFPADADLRQIAIELNQLPQVVRAVPVPTALPPQVTVASDPLLGTTDQVVVDPATGLEHQWYVFRCQADQAWPHAAGADVVIADIDWGYRVTHEDLAPRLDLARAYNAYDGGSNVSTGASVSHGTAVLGLAGAPDNGVGMVGIAPAARLWPIQADSGPGPALGGNAWARAIEWVRTADGGGRRKVIILEVQTGSYGNYEMVPSVNAAIRTAIASGVVACVAAGNGNRDAGLDDLDLPITETGSILVGATAYAASSNPRAWFSNFGDRIVVSAPGDPSHDLTCNSTSETAYRNGFGGTSGATPKVAGAAALMLSLKPDMSHAQIREILRATGSAVVTEPGKPIGRLLNVGAAIEEVRKLAGGGVALRGTPAVRRDAFGRLVVFVRGRPEALLSDIFQLAQTAPNNGWSGWSGHGHGFEAASPALGQNADGRLEVFAARPGELVHNWEMAAGGAWSGWAVLLSGPAGPPAVGRNADGRLEAFSVFADGGLRHVWQVAPNAGWSVVDNLGGSFTFPQGVPALASNADGRLEVFAIGSDGSMQHIWQVAASGNWSSWAGMGGSFKLGPLAVAANRDGRLEVFARATDGTVQHAWQVAPNGNWSGFVPLPGFSAAGPPAVGANQDGRLEVFALAADGTMWHTWQNHDGTWSPWASLGSAAGGFLVQVDAAPAVRNNADGRLEVFVIGTHDALHHSWQTAANNGWSTWASFGKPSA